MLLDIFDAFVLANGNSNNNRSSNRLPLPLADISVRSERDLYRGQSDMDYEQCVRTYGEQFARNGWRMSAQRDAFGDNYLRITRMTNGDVVDGAVQPVEIDLEALLREIDDDNEEKANASADVDGDDNGNDSKYGKKRL